MATKIKGASGKKPVKKVKVVTVGRVVKATPHGMAASMTGVTVARGLDLIRKPVRRRPGKKADPATAG